MIDYRTDAVIVTVIEVVLIVLGIGFGIISYNSGFEKGYTEALQDMKKNKPPKYILVEQKDGTMIWEENSEVKDER